MRIVVGAQPSQRFWRLCEYSNSQRVKHQKFLLSPRRLAFETSILPSIAIHSIGNLVPHTFDPLCSRACVHHFIRGKNGKNPYTSSPYFPSFQRPSWTDNPKAAAGAVAFTGEVVHGPLLAVVFGDWGTGPETINGKLEKHEKPSYPCREFAARCLC